jgi:hypothetical protein
MNIALLGKWIWKLENEEGIWQDLLRNKYLKQQTMSQACKKPGQSQFWNALMGIKDLFNSFCQKTVHNGKSIRFWEDLWMRAKSLLCNLIDIISLLFIIMLL